MKILLTGGTGLVGSRLLRRLIESDITCRALVRSGKQVPHGIEVIEGDLQRPETLKTAIEGVDAIVHLAAVFRTTDEAAIWKANLDGTQNLLIATKSVAPHVRFIMASTSNVYSENLTHPATESDPTERAEAYPASKIAAEKAVQASGLTWSIIRFPFVYGDDDGHVAASVSYFVEMKRHPAQRFSVIHHQDIATAIELALTGAMDAKIVNIADDAPMTIYDMVKLNGLTIEPSAKPLDNPWKGVVDTSLALSLGFQPKIATMYQARREHKL